MLGLIFFAIRTSSTPSAVLICCMLSFTPLLEAILRSRSIIAISACLSEPVRPRAFAAAPEWLGKGVGHALVEELLARARALGVSRVFCLTFEVDFFRKHGFDVMPDQSAVSPEVYSELLRSHDEGVAEFLDLARVKPNTLGNTRMIKAL